MDEHDCALPSQPSRDSEEEEGTESTLTTLFPGQKKRVSHYAAKGSVSLSFSRLYSLFLPTVLSRGEFRTVSLGWDIIPVCCEMS